jgi:hypothetical protein
VADHRGEATSISFGTIVSVPSSALMAV